MKNNALLLATAGLFTLVSCGTNSYTANNGGGYTNSIYYSAGSGAENNNVSDNSDSRQLQSRTNAAFNSGSRNIFSSNGSNRIDTVYVGDTNVVNIQYDPNVDYAVADNTESYEERLRKFDSPTYTINIEFNDPWEYGYYNPFWSYNCGWYRPYGITWGLGWYNPWWGTYYSDIYWGNPWFGFGWNLGWGWSAGLYWDWNPWYYDRWYGRPGWDYGLGYDRGRGRYYGSRNGAAPDRGVQMYGGNRGGGGNINNRPSNSQRASGSSYRKDPSMGQLRGGNSGINSNRGTSGRGPVYSNTAAHSGYRNNSGSSYGRPQANGGIRTYGGNRTNGSSVSAYRNGRPAASTYRQPQSNSSNRNGNSGRVTSPYSSTRRSVSSYGNNSSSNRGSYQQSSRSTYSAPSRSSYSSGSSYSGGSFGGGSHSSGGSGGGHSGGSSTRR